MKQKVTVSTKTAKSPWLDHREELTAFHRLITGLRFHVQTQHFLSARKTRQKLVIWITIAAVITTTLIAITLS